MTNLGYPIYPADRFGLIMDLMNMNNQAKEVYLTIYYDYVDGHPQTMSEVKPVWLDAAQCGTSEISGRSPGARFDFASPAWIANFEGTVLGTGGHLHDGGVKVDIVVNSKVICTSVPTYGTDEQARVRADIAKAGGVVTDNPKHNNVPPVKLNTKRQAPAHAGGHMSAKHIIAMSICAENDMGVTDIPISPLKLTELKRGQSWVLKAYYDYNQHPGMKRGGTNSMSTVMGISIMYAKTTTKRAA